MSWNRCALVSALVLTRSLTAEPEVAKIGVDEVLSYECARDVTGLVSGGEQLGPLFREGALVFWSITNADQKPVLLVDAGTGLYTIDLGHLGINRVRFELPTGHVDQRRTYFLSYLHDSAIRSRYLEFAVGAPPVGHYDLDYLITIPRRAENLRAHLDYAIFETSENTLNAIASGRLPRERLTREPVRNCEHLTRDNPTLAKRLMRNLDEVELIASGPVKPSTRMPASVR